MPGAGSAVFEQVLGVSPEEFAQQQQKMAAIDHQSNTDLIRTQIEGENLVYVDKIGKGRDALQINDLVFAMPTELTPPVAIRVDKQHINYKWETLRTNSPSKVPSGHSNARISTSLWFVGLDAIFHGLRRLIATFKTVPFVYVENAFLRTNLAPEIDDTIAVSLVGMTVRTVNQMPDVLVADLDMLWFNYKPYAPQFRFRQDWVSSLKQQSVDTSIYSLDTLEAEGALSMPTTMSSAEMLDPIKKAQPGEAYSPPVLLPQRAGPLQDYIDRNMGPVYDSAWGLSNRIEIDYKEYREFLGLDPSRIDVGNVDDSMITPVDQTDIICIGPVDLRLNPTAGTALADLAKRYRTKWGVKLPVSDAFRTRAMQEKRIAQYGPTIAASNSWHETGIAVDIPVSVIQYRVRYDWLIKDAKKNKQWFNLGTSVKRASGGSTHTEHNQFGSASNSYYPVFDSRGHYVRPAKSDVDSRGRKPDWETWHFEHIPTRNAAISKYGSVGKAISGLRSQIWFGKDSGSANEASKKDADKRAAQEEQIKDLESKGWEVDSPASSSSRLVMFKKKTFAIEEDDQGLVPQGIAVSMTNVVAQLPILSHEFATQQYLGSTDMSAVINLISVGDGRLRTLQSILQQTQNNVRISKASRENAVITIHNPLLRMMGFTSALSESISTQNVAGSPDLYDVSWQVSEYARVERNLNQEKVIPASVWREVVEFLLSRMSINKDNYDRFRKTYLYLWDRYQKPQDAEIGGVRIFPKLDFTHKIMTSPEMYWALSFFFVPDMRSKLGQKKMSFAAYEKRSAFISRLQNIVEAGAELGIVNDEIADMLPVARALAYGEGELFRMGTFGLSKGDFAPLMMRFASLIANVIHVGLPEGTLQSMGMDQSVIAASKDLRAERKVQSPERAEDQFKVTDAQQKFIQVAEREMVNISNLIFSTRVIYQAPLTPLRTELMPMLEEFRRGLPCYPDLNLPPHPLTPGSNLNTSPDFWFYNESVDGGYGVPSLRKDLIGPAKTRMMQAYNSYRELVSFDEYNNRYISYNKPDLMKDFETKSKGRDAQFKHGAAFLPDESSLALELDQNLTGEQVKKATSAGGERGKRRDLHYKRNPTHIDDNSSVSFGGQSSNVPAGEEIENEVITNSGSKRLDGMLSKSIANQDDNFFKLSRAYPTFKIYFIEDDSNEPSRVNFRNFDDFYSYNAVNDIRITKSRKIPSDLCVITLTNVTGDLDTLAFSEFDKNEVTSLTATESYDPTKVNTNKENPFSKMVLVEGAKIQVRLGYSNNPDDLEIVFNGQIVEVGTADTSSDLIQIVCQSYATELVSELKSEGSFKTTQELLSTMICSPELTHFGRWSRQGVYDPAQIRTKRTGGTGGTGVINSAINDKRDQILITWRFLNDPRDDNIFAPSTKTYSSWGQSIVASMASMGFGSIGEFINLWSDDMEFYPWGVTVWDIFKEMELRHPGFVSLAVPYGDRMSMFFGPPDHGYWSRPLSDEEEAGWNDIDQLNKVIRVLAHNYLQSKEESVTVNGATFSHKSGENLLGLTTASPALIKALGPNFLNNRTWEKYSKQLTWLVKERYKRYRPFRNYFIMSSKHNIVGNTISASSYGTHNAVELHYIDDNTDITDSDPQDLQENINEAFDDEGEILEMKADDNIEDKDIRVLTSYYPSCFNTYFARRYAVGLLMRSLRDVYKGSLVVLGEPKAKPYDVCFIYDDYRDMYGPVEIEQVTHIMSKETGFVTEIKPDIVVGHNNWTTMCVMEAMSETATQLFTDADGLNRTGGGALGGTAGVGVLSGGIGLSLMAIGGYKFVEWTQGLQPLVFTPLTIGHKPLLAGINGYKQDGLLANLKGKFEKFTDDAGKGWHDLWNTGFIKNYVAEKASSFANG